MSFAGITHKYFIQKIYYYEEVFSGFVQQTVRV